MAFPLTINAAALPGALAPAPLQAPEGEVAPTTWLPKPEGIDEAPHPDAVVNPEYASDAAGGALEKREQCTLRLRWTSNGDAFGRRYRVHAQAIPDGGVYWNSWKMAEDWALKCRSRANTGWENAAEAWQDSVDPAQAYCDVSFVHGSVGYNQYLWWHKQTA
ncbi:hypothetical protein CMUS01_08202 [Colletotrichum musicola]|uniref:Uncharacterized protein n=1 Tax=Colletotrichum musicola TaxID=2175873 RepID=A0A8H6KCY9_9PEZI|nr:hypothetical protein CMUS01_08202 [Colletotrichum musicola]